MQQFLSCFFSFIFCISSFLAGKWVLAFFALLLLIFAQLVTASTALFIPVLGYVAWQFGKKKAEDVALETRRKYKEDLEQGRLLKVSPSGMATVKGFAMASTQDCLVWFMRTTSTYYILMRTIKHITCN